MVSVKGYLQVAIKVRDEQDLFQLKVVTEDLDLKPLCGIRWEDVIQGDLQL